MRKKLKRYNLANHCHELTCSCFQRRPFLSKELPCQLFAQTLQEALQLHRVVLLAYVLMPEHFHLLVYPTQEKYKMEKFLATAKQRCSRRALAHIRMHQPEKLPWFETGQQSPRYRFWLPGGGYDRNMVEPKTIRKSIDYIHGNPVRRGLVKEPWEWKWSSARDWLLGEPGPIALSLSDLGPILNPVVMV